MQRVAGLFPPEQMKNLMISASQALRLIINQRLVKDPRDKWIPLREFLVFDASFRKRLASAHADEWPHITMEAVEKEGQSYRKAIELALHDGRITEETAAAERDTLE